MNKLGVGADVAAIAGEQPGVAVGEGEGTAASGFGEDLGVAAVNLFNSAVGGFATVELTVWGNDAPREPSHIPTGFAHPGIGILGGKVAAAIGAG